MKSRDKKPLGASEFMILAVPNPIGTMALPKDMWDASLSSQSIFCLPCKWMFWWHTNNKSHGEITQGIMIRIH